MTRHKTANLVEVKANDAGEFTALAAVFGNVDLVGDRMVKGSFANTLDRWRKSGDPIPVILSHQHDDPMALIGEADPRGVYESDEGLVVQGRLDLQDNPTAKQVHKLMKKRLLKGWSFAYTVPEGGQKMVDGVNEVNEVDLIEVGPTLKGANPEARLEAIKATDDAEPKVAIGGELFSFKEAAELLGTKMPDEEQVSLLVKWDGSPARYTDAEYAAATILDKAVCDESLRDAPPKQRYSIPIATPGNSASENPDRGGVVAAAGGRGILAVDSCMAAKTAAAKRLVRAYGKFPDLEVPDSVKQMAGMMAGASTSGTSATVTITDAGAASATAESTNAAAMDEDRRRRADEAERELSTSGLPAGTSDPPQKPEERAAEAEKALRELVAEAVTAELEKRGVDDSADDLRGGKAEQDPLRKRADELERELLAPDDLPPAPDEPEERDGPEAKDADVLRRMAHDLILATLTDNGGPE